MTMDNNKKIDKPNEMAGEQESLQAPLPANLVQALEEIVENFFHTIVNNEILEVGTRYRLGELDFTHGLNSDNHNGNGGEGATAPSWALVPVSSAAMETGNVDIFGRSLTKKPEYEVSCQKCKRSLAAERYAAHLKSCMGFGRTCSPRVPGKILAIKSSPTVGSSTSSSGAGPRGELMLKASGGGDGSSSSVSGLSTDVLMPSDDEDYDHEGHSEDAEDEDDEDWSVDLEKKKVKSKTTKRSQNDKKA